ncbi:MAG: type VI secretion system protein TssA [Planctomycetaceae bacterium]|nr:type VI secretion system protein TssA [Planctomycetaceae bacterium]
MSTDLDIESLLSPFDGDFPGGVDLRQDDDPNNAYRRIRDARSSAKDAEDRAQLDGETSLEAVRIWRDVWSEGQDYLQSYAKDLEIVAYMIEASIRLDGYAGLTNSLELTRGLIENFWGELLPLPDEDGAETTLLPISRLNSDAITFALQRVPITDDTNAGEFVLWQYSDAKRLETMSPDERERRVSDGAVTMQAFTQAVAETSDQFYRDLVTDIQAATEAVAELDGAIEQKTDGEFSVNFSRFRESLQLAAASVRAFAGDRLETADSGDQTPDDAEAGSGENRPAAAEASGIRGSISSREEALNMLEKVAAWFERHEPQSILPSELRKAKRRAMMTPEQLFKDLIADSSAREQLFRDVGIEASSDD